MKKLRKLKVYPRLPERIAALKDLAYNMWWSWSIEAQEMFRYIEPGIWDENSNNPVDLLLQVSQTRLNSLTEDKDFLSQYDAVIKEFKEYMNQDDTWFNKKYGKYSDKKIAYFCAEFGIHECIPIYSGGLGVLAGDHSKSASDLGLPFVGVGLLYRQGYFDQEIAFDGSQKNEFHSHDFNSMPIVEVKDENGNPVIIDVKINKRDVFAKVWKIQVGRVVIYLMDSDISQNTNEDREITQKLYGGGQDMRISQEILLGMGGVKVLRKLGIDPSVWHMNEGHSVFMSLERIKELVNGSDLTFYEALENVRANTIFTTHTPVPAGNDAFPLSLKDKYFKEYWESVGLSRQQFMDLGLQKTPEGFELFSLTILALKVAGRENGVSALHGKVSSDLWKEVWPDIPKEENPITHVTNGVHTLTWMSRDMKELLHKYIANDWYHFTSKQDMWKKVFDIPDEELWQTHMKHKKRLIEFIHESIKNQYRRYRFSQKDINAIDELMDPDALIIGFARRFATYKRATLLFRDVERLRQIMSNSDKKIHFVFSGKAHPADKGGQALIKNIHAIAKEEGFKGKIFFLENYSLHVARYLVRGVDVWLNNPKRPLEASGTSGQKVPVNGGLNFSILDGWWDEGYNTKNGWAINEKIITVDDDETQADIDSASLYDILENEVIETFYDRDENGMPKRWIEMMKHSMASVIPEFSMDNMVKKYTNQLYIPSLESGVLYDSSDFKVTKQVANDRYNVLSKWGSVSVEDEKGISQLEDVAPGDEKEFYLKVNCHEVSPNNIKAQLCVYRENGDVVEVHDFKNENINENIAEFKLKITWKFSGEFLVGVRIIPVIENMIHPYETGVAYWLS